MSPLSEKATYSGPWRAFLAPPGRRERAKRSRLRRAAVVVQSEATNPTMCDGDHTVLGGAIVSPKTTAQPGRHPPSPDTPTPPGSQEPTS
jgi:hypothetical protein